MILEILRPVLPRLEEDPVSEAAWGGAGWKHAHRVYSILVCQLDVM